MVSGDSFVVKQDASAPTTWSFHAPAALVITCYSGQGLQIYLDTFVVGTSGVYRFPLPNDQVQSSLNKLVFKSGQTLTASDPDVGNYGLYIGGFEL